MSLTKRVFITTGIVGAFYALGRWSAPEFPELNRQVGSVISWIVIFSIVTWLAD